MSAEVELTAEEREQAFADRLAQLTPIIAPVRQPGERPRVILFGGEPAVGKTTAQRLVHTALGEDRVASYDGDGNATVHPRYDALRRQYGVEGHSMAYKAVSGEGDRLHYASLDHLRAGETKYDIVTSHPLAREQWAKSWVDGFNDHGYRVSLAYVVTNPANSKLSRAERYQDGVDNEGGGRWVESEIADALTDELPDTAQVLESGKFVHDMYVVDRDGYVLYENHIGADGNWEREPAVKQAILDERGRPPTPEEHAHHQRTADRLLNGRDPSKPPLEPKVRQVVEEAVALENARPAPQPNPHVRDASQRIDARITAGVPAGPAANESGRPAGVDEATWKAQRAASSGMARAGSGPAPAVGSSGSAPKSAGQGKQQDSPGQGL
jgi:hypothetical protein